MLNVYPNFSKTYRNTWRFDVMNSLFFSTSAVSEATCVCVYMENCKKETLSSINVAGETPFIMISRTVAGQWLKASASLGRI